MDFVAAVQWVDKRVNIIHAKSRAYQNYTPYAPEDYLQMAYEAAITAVVKLEEASAAGRDVGFECVFWTIFKDRVAECTPCPVDYEAERQKLAEKYEDADVVEQKLSKLKDNERHRSQSLCCGYQGSDVQSKEEECLEDLALISGKGICRDIEEQLIHELDHGVSIEEWRYLLLEKEFEAYEGLFDATERVVAKNILCIGDRGCLNKKELSKELGVSRHVVRYMPTRILKKIGHYNKTKQMQRYQENECDYAA